MGVENLTVEQKRRLLHLMRKRKAAMSAVVTERTMPDLSPAGSLLRELSRYGALPSGISGRDFLSGSVVPSTREDIGMIRSQVLSDLPTTIGQGTPPGTPPAIGSRPYSSTNIEEMKQSVKNVLGGALSSATMGLTKDILPPDDPEATATRVAGFLGDIKMFGKLTKLVNKIPGIDKLPGLLRGFVRGGATGAAYGTGAEAVDVLRGEDFDPEIIAQDFAMFAAFDMLPPAYRGVKELVRKRRYAAAEKAYREVTAGLPASEAQNAAVAQAGEMLARMRANEGLASRMRGDVPSPSRAESPQEVFRAMSPEEKRVASEVMPDFMPFSEHGSTRVVRGVGGAKAAPKPVSGARTDIPVAESAVKDKYNDIIAKQIRRDMDEARGQAILDELEMRGETAGSVNRRFWEHTYDKLPPEVQRKFDLYTARLSGVKLSPGETWKDVGIDFLDFGKIEHLSGTERGFISLQAEAMARFQSSASNKMLPDLAKKAGPKVKPPIPSEEVYLGFLGSNPQALSDLGKDVFRMLEYTGGRLTPDVLMQAQNWFKTDLGKQFPRDVTAAYVIHNRFVGAFVEQMRTLGLYRANSGQAGKIADDLMAGDDSPFRAILEAVHRQATSVGLEVGHLKNYFPRVLKHEVATVLYDNLAKVARQLSESTSVADQALADVFKRMNKQTQEVLTHLIETKQAKNLRDAINQASTQAARELFPKVSFEKHRVLELPSSVYDTDARRVLTKYVNDIGKRIAEARVWGPDGADAVEALEGTRAILDANIGIMGQTKGLKGVASQVGQALSSGDVASAEYILRGAVGKTATEKRAITRARYAIEKIIDGTASEGLINIDHKEAVLARKLLDMWTGQYDLMHGFKGRSRQFVDAVIGFEFGGKIGLGTATIPNITQSVISTIPDAGLFHYVRGGLRLMSPSYRSKIRTSGALNHSSLHAAMGYRPGGIMGKFADMTAKWLGFEAANRINLYTSAATFDSAARSWYRAAKMDNAYGRWARKRLGDFDIDWSVPLDDGSVLDGMYRFATDSQLQSNILKDPFFFNDPRARPFIVFKRFGYRQAAYIKDMLMREIPRGNVFPLIRLGAGGYFGGEFVWWAKNKLKSELTGEPVYRESEHATWERFASNIAAVGTFGVIGDMVIPTELDDAGYNIAAGKPHWTKRVMKEATGGLEFAAMPVVISDTRLFMDRSSALAKDTYKYNSFGLALRRQGPRYFDLVGSLPRWGARGLSTAQQQEDRLSNRRGDALGRAMEAYLSNDIERGDRIVALWNKNNPDSPIRPKDVSRKEASKKYRRDEKTLQEIKQ